VNGEVSEFPRPQRSKRLARAMAAQLDIVPRAAGVYRRPWRDMGLLRSALLAAAESRWLREQATRRRFVRRSVRRFMPGERVEDALAAAAEIARQGAGVMLTQLGENLTEADEAEEVVRHYLDALDRIEAAGLDAEVSVKLTHLGLDLDADICHRHLLRLVERSDALGRVLWIDMESTAYVDRTLEQFRRARAMSRRVGVCLQAYLYRTGDDLEALLPLGPAIRLVKGAYREPPSLAFPRKADVDENFFRQAVRLLDRDAIEAGAFLGIATHDAALIERLERRIDSSGAPAAAWEFEMLYGVQRGLQARLVAAGRRLRVLISYGEHWFPWYMRRLAERPANMLFVARSLLSR
jgi:proline dehydrogenase